MTTSMFISFIDKYFKKTIGKLTEKWNDRKNAPSFMFEDMLDEEYTADLTWNTAELNHSIVAADVVSMDSSLPLKKRGSLRTASGDIAKIGIKYQMKEKQISDIQVMRAKGEKEAQIAAKILANIPRAIMGVKTRIEIMFEAALSSGVMLVDSDTNDGTGVRADFGYLADNTFHVLGDPWATAATATPVTDMRQMFDKANDNGDSITDMYLSKKYFDYARKTTEVKELVANNLGQTIISASTLPYPARQNTLNALEAEFNATFHVVDNSYKIEAPDGSQTSIRPWVQPNVVGVPAAKVGRLFYGTLAEDMNRVAGVTYEKSGNYILVSEYSHNEPSLAEFTAAQALAMPVIDDGGSIYVLHADSLAPISVDIDELEFTSAADTTGKKVNVHCDGEFTVSQTASTTWLTVTKRGNVLTAKVSANTDSGASERTSTITLTDAAGNTATIDVTQAA